MSAVSYAQLGGLTAAYVLAAALLYAATGLTVGAQDAGIVLALMLLAPAALLVRWRKGDGCHPLIDVAACWGLMTIVSVVGALISYPMIVGTQGWGDAWLASADRALGFDWPSAYHYVEAHPRVAAMLAMGYMSIFYSPQLILAGLTWSGKPGAARGFLFAFGIALAITLLLSRFLPARSALAYHLGVDVDFMPATGIAHIAVIEQLRAGTLTRIEIGDAVGMITFPSFHAASAILFLWAGWGVRWLRVPIAAMNLLMLVATPVQGTHYLVDVLAGICVALVSIGILHLQANFAALRRWRPRRLHAALAPV